MEPGQSRGGGGAIEFVGCIVSNLTLGDVLPRLDKAKETKPGEWRACCPAHEDSNPSLSITQAQNGRLLLHCFAGCSYQKILEALNIRPSANGNGTRPQAIKQQKKRIVTTYDYQDAAGAILFQKVRYKPKDFRIRRPDGNGGYIWNLDGVQPVLYRLPDLLDPGEDWPGVYIVEGEKDADRLARLGLIATCNYDGAGKWRVEYNQYFTDRAVYIIPDHDEPGWKHAELVASNLINVTPYVRIVTLPDLPEHGDVSDWLDAGHTREEFERVALTTPKWKAKLLSAAVPFTGATETSSDNLQPVTLDEKRPLADIEFIRLCFFREELGDGELFAHIFNGRLVYDHSENGWYLWAGHHWRRDETEQVKLLYSGQVAAQYLEAAAELSRQAAVTVAAGGQAGDLDTLVAAFTKRARQLQRKTRMTNALDYAASILGITGDIWDARPGLLPVANGIVDLETGELSPGRPSDYIRTYAPTEWQGLDTPCPRFEQFILEIMGHDVDMATFLNRLFGYAISGLAQEHKFPILWGETGRNGKDTLLETLGYVLGQLAGAVTKDVVLDPGGRRYAGAATPHLMELQGKRLVWASEPREGARLDVAQVKWITGGGRLKGRPLHGNEVEWQPTHTVMLVTNPRPHAPADDLALWERILLIPFIQRFVDNPIEANEHKADKGLKQTLKGEAAGILAWLVRGFMEWRKVGLRPSASVTKATAAYRESEDLLAVFIADACIIQEGAIAKASELYKAYVEWCKSGNTSPMWRNTFAEKMKQRFKSERKTAGNIYKGIGLLFPVKEDESDNNDRSN